MDRIVDVITGDELEHLHTFKNYPVFIGTTKSKRSDLDLVEDMEWSISKNTGVIQLKKTIPLDMLYQAQTTTNAIGETWKKHHKAFAEFIYNYRPKSIIEAGGAHGVLSMEYSLFQNISWTIIEPNPAPIDGCKAKFIKAYFDENLISYENNMVFVHSHVLEHLYEPMKFIKSIANFLPINGRMIFSIPDLKEWLKRKYTNCLNFEHTVFLTEDVIDLMLAHNGFEICEKFYYGDSHSIFYAVKKIEHLSITTINKYDENKKIFMDYVSYYESLVKELNQKLQSLTDVWLFGAHVFSQHLINVGLDTKHIKGIIDNDEKKHGERLYGTTLNVFSPKVLSEESSPVVILKAGAYDEEIIKGIHQNINKNTIFLR